MTHMTGHDSKKNVAFLLALRHKNVMFGVFEKQSSINELVLFF